MIPLEEAQAIVDATVPCLDLERQRIPVCEALGRIAAADVRSRLDLPPFDKSAMDGYALPEGEPCPRYRVLETVAAGSVPGQPLQPGTAVKVMTGAPVPAGTGRVARLEWTRCDGPWIEVVREDRDANICLRGEDLRQGDVVLQGGTRIGPIEIANLSGAGTVEIDVFRALRIAVFSTGEEVADDPSKLRAGKIMDSNGPLLSALARQWGMEVTRRGLLRDNRQATARAVIAALDEADMVVLSGGVSAGDFDFVGAALVDAGLTVRFDSVASKPGKPTTFASAGCKAAFGLPGNPVTVCLTFHLFVLRAAARLLGTLWPVRELQLPLATDFRRRKAERREYIPCRLDDQGRLRPVEYHGSAHLGALLHADGFLTIPLGCQELPAGHLVSFFAWGPNWR
jgi:molybdopterin molybdotransferase